MRNQLQNLFFGKSTKLTVLILFALFAFVGLGCKGSKTDTKPIPAAYLGDWEGQDGSTLSLRGDNSGDYRSGSTKVENGTAEVDETAKTVSITFVGIGKTLRIDQAPTGSEMKLDGVTYRRKGGSTTSSSPNSSSSPSTISTPPVSSPPTTNNSGNGDAPSDREVETLVKETLEDFGDAVEKEDFTDFRFKTSKDFQVSYTPATLKASFQAFINQKDRVLPSFSSMSGSSATFTDGPRIRTEKGYKILVANGRMSTSPSPVQFETEYELEKGEWKILKIKVIM